MTANDFLYLFEPAVEISLPQMERLAQLAEGMPWFSAAQILWLKALKQHAHPQYHEQLARAALYATRRDMLAKYLQKINPIAPPSLPQEVYDEDKYFELLHEDFESL